MHRLLACLIVFIGLYAFAKAQVIVDTPTKSFSGVFYDDYKWLPCDAEPPETEQWLYFNVTFPTSGVRRILMMHYVGLHIWVFPSTFDITDPCKNSQRTIDEDYITEYMPHIYEKNRAIYFKANTLYHIILSNEYPQNPGNGPITGELWDGSYTGTTNTATLWNPIFNTLDNVCTKDGDYDPYNVPYSTFSFTATESGNFDFTAFFEDEDLYTVYLVLYQGTPSASDLATKACKAEGFLVAAYNDELDESDSIEYSAAAVTEIIDYPLVKGTEYTMVVSQYVDDSETSPLPWGVQIRPTRRRTLNSNTLFTEPVRDKPTLEKGCKTGDSEYKSQPWTAFSFTTQPDWYYNIVVWEENMTDTMTFVYAGSGANVGSGSSAPSTCPSNAKVVDFEDEMNSAANDTTYNSGTSTTISAIVTPYFTSGVDPSTYSVQIFYQTGPRIYPPGVGYLEDPSSDDYWTDDGSVLTP